MKHFMTSLNDENEMTSWKNGIINKMIFYFFCSNEHLTATCGISVAIPAKTSATCSLASSRESSTSQPGPTPFKYVIMELYCCTFIIKVF